MALALQAVTKAMRPGTPRERANLRQAPVNSISYNFIFLITLLLIISLVAQPLAYRPAGVPITLSLIVLFNTTWWLQLKSHMRSTELLILFAITLFLIVTDLIIDYKYRGLILSILIIFVFFGSKTVFSNSQLLNLWKAVMWSMLMLALIALYRYIFGHSVSGSENSHGLFQGEGSYVYLGIQYLTSTRNSDAFYLIFGFLAAIRLSFESSKRRYFYKWMCLFFAFAILLTLSRTAYLVTIISAFLAFGFWKYFLGIISLGAVFYIILNAGLYIGFKENVGLIKAFVSNGLISILNPDLAADRLSGQYDIIYTNNSRIDLYIKSIFEFLNYPLGQGVDNVHWRAPRGDPATLHSENLFLDVLIIFGIFSFPVFYFIFKKVSIGLRLMKKNNNARIGVSVLAACVIYAFFNSPLNEVAFWCALMVGLLEVSKATQCATFDKPYYFEREK